MAKNLKEAKTKIEQKNCLHADYRAKLYLVKPLTYRVDLNERVYVDFTRRPLQDTCRRLLLRGSDPSMTISLSHGDDSPVTIFTTLGEGENMKFPPS